MEDTNMVKYGLWIYVFSMYQLAAWSLLREYDLSSGKKVLIGVCGGIAAVAIQVLVQGMIVRAVKSERKS
jgi:D-arabinose 1-dehydrogenase-like Zn-dependent alcohol dehydrogenase